MSFVPKQPVAAHLSDEQILMLADGELPPAQAAVFHEHMAACSECRARMAQLELAVAEFAELHEQRFHRQLVASAEMRSSLKTQFRQRAAEPETRRIFWPAMTYRVTAAATLLVVAAAGLWFVPGLRNFSLRAQGSDPALPIRRFTPGAVQPVQLADLCRMADADTPPAVSPSVKQQVFEEYRLPIATSQSYELDYLITPQLGGADDPKNLWPEPYGLTAWNAHIKDQLEDRLHSMVCDGSLDLQTAQRDMAVDWISAYKKYFHTQVPLNESALNGAQAGIRMPAPARRWHAGL